ncbi:RHS repeat-associated core domain-containing protein [Providencia stuartii]|uniref:RHS repeat-associated core domain-containing protein n=3 Tax=Providencia stuartii TaxID=588 RepID=UPI0034E3993C
MNGHDDALGRLIHKVVGSQAHGKPTRHETHFVWQGLRLLQEQDINTGKHQTYCYEEHGSYTPLAVIVKQPAGYRYYWHHCDINSAPLDVTNAQGNTVWSGKYERFGFVRSSPLSFYSDPDRKMESFEQNLRYAGQYFDNETGLHFNTFRFYDPQIGRFIMPDPIGLLGGINLYQYAPNPLAWVDPLGLDRFPSWMDTTQGYQRQHLIPYSLRNHPIFVQSGMSINGASNMMRLPVAKGIDPNPDLGLHRGWTKEHAIYNEMMKSKLDALERVANKEKWDYRRIQSEVLNLQHEARKGFKTGKLTCA